MEREEQKRNEQDRHLDTPSESNRGKHINFPDVEEESSKQIVGDHSSEKDRKEQWQKGVEEGRSENQNSSSEKNTSIPLDNDDTIGIP